MNKKLLLFALVILVCATFISYSVAHAFFSNIAKSTNNVFTASSQFPTATPIPTPQVAQTLVINELLPVSSCKDGNKDTNWIEVWNGSNTGVDLKNFKLSDGTNITDLVTAHFTLGSHLFALIAKDGSIFNSGSSKGNKCYADNGATTLNLGDSAPVSLTTGTIKLLQSDGTTVVDKVQFNGTFNGVALTPTSNQSIERVPTGHDTALGDTFVGTDFIVKEIPTPGYGTDLLLNEFIPHATTEKVELFNPSFSSINLTGWTLVDAANTVKSISSLGTIVSSGFAVFSNPAGWLNDTGPETLFLKNPSGQIIDSHFYTGAVAIDKSIGRVTDGASLWKQTCTTSSIGTTNNGMCL